VVHGLKIALGNHQLVSTQGESSKSASKCAYNNDKPSSIASFQEVLGNECSTQEIQLDNFDNCHRLLHFPYLHRQG